MEKLVANRLHHVLENLQTFSNYQFGFHKFRSTPDALLHVNRHSRRRKWFHVLSPTWRKLMTLYEKREFSWNYIHWVSKVSFLCSLFLSFKSVLVCIPSIFLRSFIIDKDFPQGSILSVILFAVTFNYVILEIPKII